MKTSIDLRKDTPEYRKYMANIAKKRAKRKHKKENGNTKPKLVATNTLNPINI